jgi:hypothetical protein
MKRYLLLTLTLLLFISGQSHSYQFLPAHALTGGGTGAIDKIDGATISQGDVILYVNYSTLESREYVCVADSATDNGDTVIAPDTNPGTKRWHLTSKKSAGYTSPQSTSVVGNMFMYSIGTNGYYQGFEAADTMTGDSWLGKLTATKPSGGEVMEFATPTGSAPLRSAQTWVKVLHLSGGTMTGALDLDLPLLMAQNTTPANPAASHNKLYFKSDDKLYKLTSGGTETEVGAASGTLSNIVEDTTPQLGGDLDINGHKITATATANPVAQWKSTLPGSSWQLLATGVGSSMALQYGSFSGDTFTAAGTIMTWTSTGPSIPTGTMYKINGTQIASTNLSDVSSLVTLTGSQALTNKTINGMTPSSVGTINLTGGGGVSSAVNGATGPNQNTFGTNAVNVASMDFDKDTQQYSEWSFVLPADYNGGTITAKFVWEANDTSTNSVIWGCQGRVLGDGDLVDQAWGTAVEVTDANASTALQVRISGATGAITLAGTPAAGKMVTVRVYRKAADGSDTLAATASLLHVILTYTKS